MWKSLGTFNFNNGRLSTLAFYNYILTLREVLLWTVSNIEIRQVAEFQGVHHLSWELVINIYKSSHPSF
jgi:hypothetical protein